ncbi:stage II sporulation protein D [Serpentinicella alkaliphila]|uniref:Stage II sporulation protein D n=1 Tax=Serpentinicella alkaliphila TaxID=1734049 RepID=A0A4R2U4Y3_9FIRM|nr:stage II sporulation protein D [Serpentinicella alkaliphila]QUH24950.1 stage II sporulation protein D [Serpentinicella alkaliphila]TCQ02753.1 stage II sporulation protein D [Serpentinicella alkaliphila]
MRGIFFAIFSFVVVVVLIPLVILTSCDINILPRNRVEERAIIESDLSIKIYNHETKQTMELYLEDYLLNVVASEMPAAFEIEALKAQAVAARTYAIWRYMNHSKQGGHPEHPSAVLCTSHTHCQEWLSTEELLKRHGQKWFDQYWSKIEEAVNSTTGVVMTYNMNPIEPLYHSTSGGATENSEDVFATAKPYLRSVSSPYEQGSPVLVDNKVITVKEFINRMKREKSSIKISERNLASQIKIIQRTQGGSIKEIQIGDQTFTGSQIRRMFDLRSADFNVDINGSSVEFTTRGYGHGVGMSQWGANGMAKQGSDFEEILSHYYQGITLNKIKSYK